VVRPDGAAVVGAAVGRRLDGTRLSDGTRSVQGAGGSNGDVPALSGL
jgi:hypothetical protein